MTDLHVVILIRPGTCPPRVGAAFAAVLVALLAFAFPALAAVIKIDRISVTVSDLARTEKFYRDALGFETVRRGRQDNPSIAHLLGVEGASFETLTMRLGAQEVEFIKFQKHGRQHPPTVIVRTCGFSTSRSSSATWTKRSVACSRCAPPRYPLAAPRRFLLGTARCGRSNSATPTGIRWSFCIFLPAKAVRFGTNRRGTTLFWGSIIPRLGSPIPRSVSRSMPISSG